MKLFVTGATGFIGRILVQDLLEHGHTVLGLARSESSAEKLIQAGAEVIRGDLENLEALKQGARESDGVIHLGFIPDFANYEHSCEVDSQAVHAITDELKGTGKVFVYTSGLMGIATDVGVEAYETDRPPNDAPNFGKRFQTENYAMDIGKNDNIRSMVVRLPPTVHDAVDDQAFIPQLIRLANEKKVSYYIGEGTGVWPAIHRKDAATLYRLAAEKGIAGFAYHAVAEANIQTKTIAETIAEKFNIPAKSLPKSKAFEEFGFFGLAFAANMQPSTERTRKELGWEPKEIGLIEDIVQHYEVAESNIKF